MARYAWVRLRAVVAQRMAWRGSRYRPGGVFAPLQGRVTQAGWLKDVWCRFGRRQPGWSQDFILNELKCMPAGPKSRYGAGAGRRPPPGARPA
eukprot:363970-Chlamydomonas_euryale.AAC.2